MQFPSPEGDDRARMERMFRLCLCRAPEKGELTALLDYLEGQRQVGDVTASGRGAAHHGPERSGGTSQSVRVSSEQENEAGAWTAAARVLMNLDEFITRE